MSDDYIEIGALGSPIVTFGVNTANRPNPLTTPQRQYIYKDSGQLARIVDRINLNCWFVYEPDEIWSKFEEIKAQLLTGILDFRYYRPAVGAEPVLNLQAIDHVASPRYENIVTTANPGSLANHINFTMDVVAEHGVDFGKYILDVDRTIKRVSKPEGQGGTQEQRSITVKGYETQSKQLISAFLAQGKQKDLATIEYTDRPDALTWSATASFDKDVGKGIDAFHETISVSGGGQPINFFGRTGSRLPLPIVGKVLPYTIVITGEIRGSDPSKLKLPKRAGQYAMSGGQTGVKGKAASGNPDTKEVLRKLGKSGATQFSIGVVESNPDGTPKTYQLLYTETYKRAIEEEKIFEVLQKDYMLRSVSDIEKGETVVFGNVGKPGQSFFQSDAFGQLRWGFVDRVG